MKARTLIAGVLGGMVLFAWGAISHMALGLGDMGIKVMPREDAVLTAMRDNVPEPGFYFFPGGVMSGEPTAEQQKRWEEKYRQGPTGILIYQPQGWEPFDPMQFITELLADIGAALIAAFLLSAAGAALVGFASRVVFVTALSLVASLDLHVSYWNWYRFPADYTLGVIADALIGWVLVGVVLAAILKPRTS